MRWLPLQTNAICLYGVLTPKSVMHLVCWARGLPESEFTILRRSRRFLLLPLLPPHHHLRQGLSPLPHQNHARTFHLLSFKHRLRLGSSRSPLMSLRNLHPKKNSPWAPQCHSLPPWPLPSPWDLPQDGGPILATLEAADWSPVRGC